MLNRLVVLGAAACLIWALGHRSAKRPQPRGEGATSHAVRYEIGVYHLPRPACDPKAALARALRAGSGISLLASAPPAPPAGAVVWLESRRTKDYAPPEGESLKFFGRGLSAEQEHALVSSEVVSVLTFAAPAAKAIPTYREALGLAGAFASACGGLVWDDEARLVFSQSEWAKRSQGWSADGLPEVSAHTIIHEYRDGDLLRMITLGMAKLGLPDIVVNQVPGGQTRSMETLINLLCQRMVEGQPAAAGRDFELAIEDVRHAAFREDVQQSTLKNARGRAVVHLALAKHDEGDPDNLLLEVVFPGPAAELQERQGALLSELFGSEDQLVRVHHDAALLAASARARKAALRLKPRYTKSPPLGELLEVKAPFKTSGGGNEWMWVEVVRWEGTTIHGVLRNDPDDVPALKAGARVDVEESSIFDYILVHPDGSREGNETGPLIESAR